MIGVMANIDEYQSAVISDHVKSAMREIGKLPMTELDVDVSIRCSGVYSYRIADPLLFYTKVCGNVSQDYTRDELDS